MVTDNIVRFTTVFLGEWSPANEVFPIISNLYQTVIGGFLVVEGPAWKCFMSRTGYTESMSVSDGQFYLTPKKASDGSIIALIVSDMAINTDSKLVDIGDYNEA